MITAEIVTLITGITSLIGAFAMWRKSRHESNKIKTDTFNQEVLAIREAYSQMLKDQIENIVDPMEKRIDRLVNWNQELQNQIDELKNYRNLFDLSILYIRSLCHWIDALDISAKTPKPKLPTELREYFDLQDNKSSKEGL